MIGKIYLCICILTFVMYLIMILRVFYRLNYYDLTPLKHRNKEPFEKFTTFLQIIFASIIPLLNIALLYVFLFQSTDITEDATDKIVKRYNLQKKGDNNE